MGAWRVYRCGGGKRRVWERAVGRKAITLQTAGPWKVNGSCLVRTMRSAATIGQRMSVAGAEDGYILGRHTRPRGPDSAWCWLIARFMSAQKQTFEVWLVDRWPWR